MINLQAIADEIKQLLIDEWVKQGHRLTGAFEAGLEYEITTQGDDSRITFYDTTERGYGKIINDGVTADRIPFYPGSGNKTSKYIQGLVNYAKLRMGASDKDAVSIAFAIAYKHKKEGMPTEASKRFSSTGKRVNFVGDATQEVDDIIEKHIQELVWQ